MHPHQRVQEADRPTDGLTDLGQASLIPRQESWGLTHWLGDSHSSHLCLCVWGGRLRLATPLLPTGQGLSLLRLLHTHTWHTQPASGPCYEAWLTTHCATSLLSTRALMPCPGCDFSNFSP